ncbi:MAG: PucR family transcriptional regulator [Lactobacillales bacterium]|jgi:sugar diacid utilization regulator|nr:PucR family transcriptional regulator [Lactobacillales bacterium]
MKKNISIQEIVKLAEFNQSDLISTKNGLLNVVETVTIMDIPNMDDWVKKGDLLIIGLFLETHLTEKFLHRLHEKEIAGIITKKKFKHFLTPELIQLFHLYNIPIIIIEDKYSWSDVMTPIQRLIIEKQTISLRETEQFHQTIFRSLSDEQSLNNLCSAIYNVSGLSLAVVDENFNLLDSSFDFSWGEVFEDFSSKKLSNWMTIGHDVDGKPINGFCFTQSIKQAETLRFFFFPLYKKRKIENFIVLKPPIFFKELNSEIVAKLQSFSSFYQLKKTIFLEFQKANLHYRNLILEELLNSTSPDSIKKRKYSLVLGTQLEQQYRLVLVKNLKQTDRIDDSEEFLNFEHQFYKTQFSNENILLFNKDKYWFLLVGESYSSIEFFIESLYTLLKETYKHSSFQMGISDLQPFWKLTAAWQEAKQALLFTENNTNVKPVQFYKDLGIFKLFIDDFGKINQYFIQKMLEDFVYPIIDYDTHTKTELYHTLETYFANDFSHTQTCKMLFIHKNTLRARLKKIEEILSVNINNADTLMNLHLGIRLNQVIKQN